MKAVRLPELRALLGSHVFEDFWTRLRQARAAFADASDQHDELLTQATLTAFRADLAQKRATETLFQAGEAEDTAARLLAEASTWENRGLELVGQFEEQRYVSSDHWYRLNAAERSRDERRDAVEAARAGGGKELGHLEAELATAERHVAELRESYLVADRGKQALWEEVEAAWARSAEISLVVAEKQLEAKRIKRRAELLFRQAEERSARAAKLREDADALARAKDEARTATESLLASTREALGGVATGDFLYFRSREQQRAAYAVALVADPDTYNLELQELHVYQVDRSRGVGFLEPAVDGVPSDADGDRRFEKWFLEGRKGVVRPEPDPRADADASVA